MRGQPKQSGFTLVEMLVTLVIAMVIMGGLLLTFTQQYGEYKYQNKRIDAAQDLEFAIGFIAADLRSALVVAGAPDIAITNIGTDPYTSQVDIGVWEPDVSFWTNASEQSTNNYRAVRRYDYDKAGESLRYDRNTVPSAGVTEILPNVTDFRVFQDTAGAQPILSGTTPFPGSPVGLQPLNISDSLGNSITSDGFTILIEVAVDAGYKQGSFINARGVDVRTFETSARKRIWRYRQVHPLAAAE